jgi:hypothetical protein
VGGQWGSGSEYRRRPEAASQLAEMTHPNRPFISASEGQQVDFDSSHISNDWWIQW